MPTMDSFKRVRKKLLTCFRPPVSDEDGSNRDNFVTYVSLHDQDTNKMVLRKFVTSLPESTKFNNDACKKDKISSRRAFSRAVKAVLFDNSLAKKIRRRKHKKVAPTSDSNRSLTTIGGDSNLKIKRRHPEALISGDSTCSWSSLTYSTSSSFSSINPSALQLSSSASSMPPPNSTRFSEQNRSFHAGLAHPPPILEQDKGLPAHGVGKKCNSNLGLCLILLCLLVLMTWGRVFAIFCTSACLFMIPSYVYRRRIVGVVAPGQRARLTSSINSAEHKKRVIMEGWLERRRRVS